MDNEIEVSKAQTAIDLQFEIDLELEGFPVEQQSFFGLVQGGMALIEAADKAGVKQRNSFLDSDRLKQVVAKIRRKDALLNGIPIDEKRAILLDIADKARDTTSKACNLSSAVSAIKLLALLDKNIVTAGAANSPQVVLNITGLPAPTTVIEGC